MDEVHAPKLHITRSKHTGWLVITLTGEMDCMERESLDKLRESAALGRNCVIDLRGLGFIDSTGLGCLMAMYKRLKETDLKFRLVVQPTGPLRRILQITGLDRVFVLAETIEAAIESPEPKRQARKLL